MINPAYGYRGCLAIYCGVGRLEMDENNIFAGGNLVTRPATVIPVIGHQKIACEGYR